MFRKALKTLIQHPLDILPMLVWMCLIVGSVIVELIIYVCKNNKEMK